MGSINSRLISSRPGKNSSNNSPVVCFISSLEVHHLHMIKETFYFTSRHFESIDKKTRKITSIECRPNVKLWIDETYVLQLNNGIGNLLGPIFTARFNHSNGKTMKGNIKNMPSPTAKTMSLDHHIGSGALKAALNDHTWPGSWRPLNHLIHCR